MKKKVFAGIVILTLVFGVLLSGCDEDDNTDPGNQTPTVYKDFENYPTGMAKSNGMLTISNKANKATLLFYGTAAPERYVATVDPLGVVKVNLPSEGPYSIIAIDKAAYETQGFKASQTNEFTFFSNTQAFSISVSPTATWGAGILRVNNYSDYWVQLKSPDNTQTYGVIQPKAMLVNIPVSNGTYHFIPNFYKQIRVNNTIVGVIDMPVTAQANSFTVEDSDLLHIFDFVNSDVSPNTTPIVQIRNRSSVGIQVFRSGNQMVDGTLRDDYIVNSGRDSFISGFKQGDNTNEINFRAIAWQQNHRYVPQDITMEYGRAYIITLPQSGLAADIIVEDEDATPFFQ